MKSLLLIVTLGSGGVALFACGSGTTTASNGDAGAGTSGASGTPVPASCAVDAGIGCNTLAFGDIVHPTCGTGAPPAATGGSITGGTYVLTARVEYDADCATTPSRTRDVRGAAAFGPNTLDLAVDNDPPCKDTTFIDSKQRQTWKATANGLSLSGPQTCDTNNMGLSTGNTWKYTVTGDTVILMSGSVVSTYARVP